MRYNKKATEEAARVLNAAVAKSCASIGALSSAGRQGVIIIANDIVVNIHENAKPKVVPLFILLSLLSRCDNMTLHARKAPTAKGPNRV